MESLRKQAANLLREQKKYRRWLAVFLCLAVLVTSGTVASLMMKGQAMSKKQKVLECHLSVHEHTEECYETDPVSEERKLICGYADYVVHTHTDECRDAEGVLVCTLPEVENHMHDENCFREEDVLICGQEESAGHIHTEACRTLICGKEESKGHTHTEECRTLICGQEESAGHVHTEACVTVSQGTLMCQNTEEGHQHTEDCYEKVETVTCGKEEGEGSHTHTEACWDPKGCGLEEGAQAHTHTEECYDPHGCGLEEGEGGHAHTTECYETRKSVICGKLELHTHVKEGENSCYDADGKLICGIPELKEHVHGEDCFRIVEETDGEGADKTAAEGDTASTENGVTEEDKTGADTGKNEAVSDQEETGTGGENDDKTSAEADGKADDAESADADGKTDNATAAEDDGETGDVTATEADGETEGEKPASGTSETDGTPASGENTEQSGDIPADGKAGAEYTLTAQGEDYTVTVTYGPEAKIPENAKLSVREIQQGTEEYEGYYQEMLAAVTREEGTAPEEGETADIPETDTEQEVEGTEGETEDEVEVVFARFFDITFMVDGEKIEPEAPVDIRVSYQDSIELGEDETASAVHFAKDGTEVLDADVEDGEEGSDFTFTQNSFSVTSNVVINRAAKKKTTDTLKATTKDGDVSFTIIGENTAAFLTTDRLAVNEIKDNGESGNNSYRKYLNNSTGAIKDKTNQKDEELEVFSARVFEISIQDQNGNKKSADNVQVSIQYSSPVKAEKAGSMAMVLNNEEDGGQVLNSKAVSAGQEITAFSGIQSFSANASNVVTAMVAGIELQEDGTGDNTQKEPDKSILTKEPMLGYLANKANEWQIVEEQYGVKSTITEDGHVRLTKSVIPTNEENKFLVYLSIDTKTSVKSYFDTDVFKALVHAKNEEIGEITNNSNFVAVSVGEKANKWDYVRLLSPDGTEVVYEGIIGWGKDLGQGGANGANVSLVIYADGRYFMIEGLPGNGEKGPVVERKLGEDVYEAIKKDIVKSISLIKIEDTMGDFIKYQGPVTGDYTSEPEKDSSGKIITWTPVPKDNPVTVVEKVGDKEQYIWGLNVAELVYWVKLDVTEEIETEDGKEAFESCADTINEKKQSKIYPVNKSATLTYSSEGEEAQLDFPIPKVRGLLYDYELRKIGKDNEGGDLGVLPDAVFTAVGTSGDGNGKTYTATSNAAGKVLFPDMPWGTYTITETQPPEGYEASSETITVELCHTDHPGTLISDTRNEKPKNMIPDGAIKEVINKEKNLIILEKVWEDNESGNTRPDSVDFQITYRIPGSDEQQEKTETLTSADGWTKDVELPSGAFDIQCYEPVVPGDYAIKMPEEGSTSMIKGDAVVTEISRDADKVTLLPDGTTKTELIQKTYQKYTITNMLEGLNVRILKKAELPDGDGNTVYLDQVTFEVYTQNPDLEGNKDLQPNHTWTSPAQEGQKGLLYSGKLERGEYWLKETAVPEGYGILEGLIKITVTIDGITVEGDGIAAAKDPDTGDWTIEITNKRNKQQVLILKKDAETGTDGNLVYLNGAEFDVYDKNPNDSANQPLEAIDHWVSGELTVGDTIRQGVLLNEELDVGTYWLVETKAPDGYNRRTDPFVITVSPTGVSAPDVITPNGEGIYIIEISNSAGFELPETGSTGTNPYTVGGAMLATAAAFLMYGYSVRRKKCERRSNR